jgi:hypothetical protein
MDIGYDDPEVVLKAHLFMAMGLDSGDAFVQTVQMFYIMVHVFKDEKIIPPFMSPELVEKLNNCIEQMNELGKYLHLATNPVEEPNLGG